MTQRIPITPEHSLQTTGGGKAVSELDSWSLEGVIKQEKTGRGKEDLRKREMEGGSGGGRD